MFSMIVAIEPNKGIGLNGVMPWHIKEELKNFKANTIYQTIIMGRTTYEGLPRKLADRKIIVVSRDCNYTVNDPDVTVVNDLEKFLVDHKDDETNYIICGGANIYRQAYKYVTEAKVSFVKKEYECDTYLDCFNIEDWDLIEESEHDEYIYRYLRRK